MTENKIKMNLALLPKLDEDKEYEINCASKDYTQLMRFLNKATSLSNVEIVSFEKDEYDFTIFCPITGQFIKPGLAGFKLNDYPEIKRVNVHPQELIRALEFNKDYFVKVIIKMLLSSKKYMLDDNCINIMVKAIVENYSLINYDDFKFINFNKLATNNKKIAMMIESLLFIGLADKKGTLVLNNNFIKDLNKFQVRSLLKLYLISCFYKETVEVEIPYTDPDCGPILENHRFRQDFIRVNKNVYSCKFDYKQIIFNCKELPVKFNGTIGTTTKTVITNKYLRDGEIIEENIINNKTYKGSNFLEDDIRFMFKEDRFLNVKVDILTERYNKVTNSYSDEEKLLLQLAGTADIESAKWLIDNGMFNETLPVTVLLDLADQLELSNIRKSIEEKIKAGLMPEPDTSIEYFGNQIYFEDEVNASSEEVDEAE